MHQSDLEGFWDKYSDLIVRHLTGENDFLLVVLKSHLIVEEALNERFTLYVGEEIASDVHLSFYAKTQIIQGLLERLIRGIKNESDFLRLVDTCFDYILKLNSVRNELAHRLDSSSAETKQTHLLHATAKALATLEDEPGHEGVFARDLLDEFGSESYVEVKAACAMTCSLLVEFFSPDATV